MGSVVALRLRLLLGARGGVVRMGLCFPCPGEAAPPSPSPVSGAGGRGDQVIQEGAVSTGDLA